MHWLCSKNNFKGLSRVLAMVVFIVGCLAGGQSSFAIVTEGGLRGEALRLNRRHEVREHHNPPPHLPHRLAALRYEDGDNVQPALLFYRIVPQQGGVWDNLILFMYNTDRAFFAPSQSRTVQVAGILGGLVGVSLPATPVVGATLWTLANQWGVPMSGTLLELLTTEMMLTPPVFARQFYTRAQTIARYFTGETQFSPSNRMDNHFHVYESSGLHTALRGLIGVNAALDGAFMWGIIGLAEREEYKYVTFGMGWVTALAFAERSYAVGVRSLDRLFVRYMYSDELTDLRRRILIEKVKQVSEYVTKRNEFTEGIYETVQQELGIEPNAIDSQHYFALSALFFRHGHRASRNWLLDDEYQPLIPAPAADADALEMRDNFDRLVGQYQNERMLIADLSPSRKKSSMMENASVFLTGVGNFARLFGRQYLFQQALETVLSPEVANMTAWGLAGLNIAVKTIQEYNLQKNYMNSWLNTFSFQHLVDFPWLRKSASGVSYVNGSLYAAMTTGLALAKFNEMSAPVLIQVLSTIPGFILDQGYGYDYSNEELNESITAAATMREDITVRAARAIGQSDIVWKRACCHDWLKKLETFLETANTETIGNLYTLTQRIF